MIIDVRNGGFSDPPELIEEWRTGSRFAVSVDGVEIPHPLRVEFEAGRVTALATDHSSEPLRGLLGPLPVDGLYVIQYQGRVTIRRFEL